MILLIAVLSVFALLPLAVLLDGESTQAANSGSGTTADPYTYVNMNVSGVFSTFYNKANYFESGTSFTFIDNDDGDVAYESNTWPSGFSKSNGVLTGTATSSFSITFVDYLIDDPDESSGYTINFTVLPTVTYKLTYRSQGSEVYSQMYGPTLDSSHTFTIPDLSLSRDGYLFLGWSFDGSQESTRYQTGDTVTLSSNSPSRTIIAVWAKLYTYNLYYNANGGSGAPSSQSYGPTTDTTHNFTVSGTVPYRSGYTFLGWSTYSDATTADFVGGNSITTNYGLTSRTLYAVWQASYTVTFVSGGNGSVSQTYLYNVPSGSSITVSNNTVTINGTTVTATANTGYYFGSWSNTSGTVTANRTITASFTVMTYTVTLSPDTGGSVSPSTIANVPYGSSITTSGNTITINGTTATATASSGYGFTRWAYYVIVYEEPLPSTVTEDITIHALFEQVQTFTLIYDGNGGTGAPASQTYTGAEASHGFTVSYTIPTRSGYRFYGWAGISDATNAPYQGGDTFVVWGDNTTRTLYAVWARFDFTLDYDANGGSGAPISQYSGWVLTPSYTFTVSSTVPTREGYTFYGWSNSTDGTVQWVGGDSLELSQTSSDGTFGGDYEQTYTVYAVWTADTYTYVLEYDVGEGSPTPASQTVTVATSTYSMTCRPYPETPTRTGYTFQGWDTSSAANIVVYVYDDPVPMTGVKNGTATLTLYAVWGLTECSYYLMYNTGYSNFSDGPYRTIATSYTFTVTDTVPSELTYTFIGWSEDPDHSPTDPTGILHAGDTYTVVNSERVATLTGTLYAVWSTQPLTTFSLVYAFTGGSMTVNGSVYNNSYTVTDTGYVATMDFTVLANTPTKSPSTFLGWADSSTATVPNVFGGDTVTITASGTTGTLTIYAIWQSYNDDVTYWSNGEYNGSVSILYHLDSPETLSYYTNANAIIYRFIGADSSGMFTPTQYHVTIEVMSTPMGSGNYNAMVTATVYDPSDSVIASDTYEFGRWGSFIVTIDANTSVVSVTKVSQFRTFTSYTKNETTNILDYSSVYPYRYSAIDTITFYYLGNAPRQQIMKTSVFMNTYGVVMNDPSIDIDYYWPNMTNLRFNIFSFALYGTSATFNGITLPVNDGRVTITYANSDTGYVYDANGGLSKTLTLQNIYLTWQDGHCYLTFNGAGFEVDLGEYTNRNVSFDGVWYFSSGLYKSYQATETEITKDWWAFSFDFTAFALILAALLTFAGIYMRLKTRAKTGDYLIIIGAIALALIMAGGVLL